MNAEPVPTTIQAYLTQLKAALAGADPALIQDALNDAEEYLRGELAASPGAGEAEVVAAVASSYGAPEEVAEIYRETEATVQAALRPGPLLPRPAARQARAEAGAGAADPPPLYAGSAARRVFGVFVDPRTWGALFYMLLALATGCVYFVWTVTGLSLGLGLMVLIIGLPFLVLFIAASRVIALVEGRIVEAMLGERMPRRAPFADASLPLLQRIGRMIADPQTWSALLYFVLMLPLGVVYFSAAVTGLSLSLGLLFGPLLRLAGLPFTIHVAGSGDLLAGHPAAAPLVMLAGVAVLLLTLHGARLVGRGHGRLAKALLVER